LDQYQYYVYTGTLLVGNYGSGILNILNGGTVSTKYRGSIGDGAGSTGMVTVDGTGSTWTNGGTLSVGNSGSGTLNITNGGIVTVTGNTYVAYNNTATGSINFGANGGNVETQSLSGCAESIHRNRTINTRGLFFDDNLIFNNAHGLNRILNWNAQVRI